MEVKGIAMNARLAFVRKHFGPDGEAKLFEKLPELKNQFFGTEFLPSKMFSYDAYIQLNQAVDDLFFGGNEDAYIAMGEESATEALGSVHRVFVSNRDVKSFLRSLPIIYGAYYKNLGHAVVEVGALENFATASIHGVSNPHRSLCRIIYGYIKKGIELCGGTSIAIKELSCLCRNEPDCKFEIIWN